MGKLEKEEQPQGESAQGSEQKETQVLAHK
jgi:hypothetical protein